MCAIWITWQDDEVYTTGEYTRDWEVIVARRPIIRAALWLWQGTPEDVEKARKHAQSYEKVATTDGIDFAAEKAFVTTLGRELIA